MPVRNADARWEGDLPSGKGTMRFGGGAFEGQYSFSSRFEDGAGTNPEELIAAAHASCFSMALSNMLAEAGHVADAVSTTARVELRNVDGVPTITRIELATEGRVPGIGQDEFADFADQAKAGCPVSRALAGVGEMDLQATLTS